VIGTPVFLLYALADEIKHLLFNQTRRFKMLLEKQNSIPDQSSLFDPKKIGEVLAFQYLT